METSTSSMSLCPEQMLTMSQSQVGRDCGLMVSCIIKVKSSWKGEIFNCHVYIGKYLVSVHGIKYTPLGISIVFNHEMIAHRLLDHPDIDVNKKTCESTALHYAALRNSVSLIEAICAKVWIWSQIKFMLSYKMLPMQPDVKKNERDFLNGGLTPLMVAVKHKHVEAVRKMVKLKVHLHFS